MCNGSIPGPAKIEIPVHTAAQEIEQAGGRALAVVVDVRDERQIHAAVEQAVSRFGGIDSLVLNASALTLTNTLNVPTKKFDLMAGINMRGTFLMGKACLPHLIKADNPAHPLHLAPAEFRRALVG